MARRGPVAVASGFAPAVQLFAGRDVPYRVRRTVAVFVIGVIIWS